MTFNQGKPYHGSDIVSGGKLTGKTDTDYFYFICPQCGNGHIMRILDYNVSHDGKPEHYPDLKPTPVRDFTIAFQLHCPACGLIDFVKISNTGWQGVSCLA